MVLLVEVEDRRITKPFLGGWRHKLTSVEYLNAASQTGPPSWKMRPKDTCSRMVQYVEMKDKYTQVPYHRSTQMWRPDCYISSESDKYLTVKPYETYEEMQLRLDPDGKARIIQRNYRAYRIRKFVRESAAKYRQLVENCADYEQEKLIMYRKRHREEIIRKMYPKTRADFDMLYELIEKWRHDRLGVTRLRLFKPARCAENYSILEKTVEMFNVIDEKRRALKTRRKRRNRTDFLTTHCEPVRWNGYKEIRVEMITMRVQKARELKSIYDSLTNNDSSREERMALLIMLKKSLEVHRCASAFDLLYLFDEELTLLERGIGNLLLGKLRERMAHKYLCFVRASESCGCTDGDEDRAKKSRNEMLRGPVEPRTKVCPSCSKLLPVHKFAVHGRMKKLSTCVACTWLRERNTGHVNYDPYMFLLRCVRADESRRNCSSALAFMMQKRDIYHLVNVIWHGHSIVSKNRDLFALRLIRYDRNIEWSPWNCILLTHEEAEIHCKLKVLTGMYSKHLLEQIALAHQLARNHFTLLSAFEADFRLASRWHSIKDRTDYDPGVKVDSYYFD